MELPDDPLSTARARLEDTLDTLRGGKDDPAMMLAARNAVVALGGLVRFGAGVADLSVAVEQTAAAVQSHLEKDPGESLNFPLLDSRAVAMAQVVRERGDLATLDNDDRQTWIEEAYEIFANRDAADAWLLGAAALLRFFTHGPVRTHLERARERAVGAIVRFDRALAPALGGLSPLREDAKKAVMRARSDRAYLRRSYYWVKIIDGA